MAEVPEAVERSLESVPEAADPATEGPALQATEGPALEEVASPEVLVAEAEVREVPSRPASGRHYRRDERYPVEGHAEVIVVGEPKGTSLLRGRILDISVSGCFIQTIARVRLRPETKVEIFFAVDGNVIRALGASRFSKSKVGIGFRFLAMTDEMQDKLDELIDDARAAWMRMSEESRAVEHGLAEGSGGTDVVPDSPRPWPAGMDGETEEARARSARWNPFGVNR